MDTRTVIVTGASRGMGAATARILAGLGAHVILFARTKEDLDKQTDIILRVGGSASAFAGDVSNRADCVRLIDEVIQQTGRIDALVNNAGIIQPLQLIANADMEAWSTNLAINLLGPISISQAALPFLRDQRGRIVNISSGAALRTILGWGAYSVAKAALDHFTRILAAEEPDLVCLGLRPGVVDTAMQVTIIEEGKRGMPAAEYQKFVQQREDGKLIHPDLPGKAAAILALYAPPAWSGRILDWNAEEVAELVSSLSL